MNSLNVLWEIEWDFKHGDYVPLKKREKAIWQEQGLEGRITLDRQKKGMGNL